ncbi:ROK family protein [Cohnella faecalis]|uniref:ROK family protein n=2 Tax=Cohnella faecalis TaxID=2315694 RepID=A0A398CUS9_9BACL|nr:ROK family protein [Cohnella faecalis]RIE03051.1 ROK family protein [Cohnella faecalis]
MSYVLGMDVGGTNVVAGLFDSHGTLVRKIKTPTEKRRGADGLLLQLAGFATELLDAEGVARERLGAIGLGLPGFIDPIAGLVDAANLPLSRTPVSDRLGELTGVPVTVQNDVKMIVYGESLRGAGQNLPHVLGVTLGTGMASAWVSQGRLHDGAGNLAGELGHITFPDIPYVCGCGMKGCIETVASATGIARQARDAIAEGWEGPLSARVSADRLGELTSKDVSEACRAGDSMAIEIYRRTANWLSQALVPVIAVLCPDVIVVGGG